MVLMIFSTPNSIMVLISTGKLMPFPISFSMSTKYAPGIIMPID